MEISTQEFSDKPPQSEREMVDEWVKTLIEEGKVGVNTPKGLEGREFVVTYRTGSIKNESNMQVLSHDAFVGGGWRGANEVIVLDLLEKKKDTNGTSFVAVGSRDYRISRKPDGVVAMGNNSARIDSLPRTVGEIDFKSVDNNPSSVGIEIDKSLQGHGFGSMMAALGLRVLDQRGIQEVDFQGTLKPKMMKIMKGLGLKDETFAKPIQRQKMGDFNTQSVTSAIKPFVSSPS